MTDLNLTIPGPQGATPAQWRFQPYYGRRVADGPVKNRFGSLFVPIPGQKLGSQSVVMTIGFRGQVDEWWFAISDEHARLIEAAPAMRDALEDLLIAIRNGWDLAQYTIAARSARSALALAQGAASTNPTDTAP